jgi:hypothetical protein
MFIIYFPNNEKLKFFVETFTPLFFEEQLYVQYYVCPIWIFIFDTDQTQINSVGYSIFIYIFHILAGLQCVVHLLFAYVARL